MRHLPYFLIMYHHRSKILKRNHFTQLTENLKKYSASLCEPCRKKFCHLNAPPNLICKLIAADRRLTLSFSFRQRDVHVDIILSTGLRKH